MKRRQVPGHRTLPPALLFAAALAATAAAAAPAPNPIAAGPTRYGIKEEAVALSLFDIPVGYIPPVGPSAAVSLLYDMYDVSQPATFNFFNVSQKWSLNWLSFVEDDPGSPGASVGRYDRNNGFLYSETGYDDKTRAFAPEEDDASVLVLKKTSPITYERLLQDGTVETYAESDGGTAFPRRIFLSKISDPQGNTLILDYGKTDGEVRLLSLTDATGRKTTFGYGSRASPLLITRITDPFGRTAEFGYDSSGRLSSITDVLGLTSKFTYDASSLIDRLTTPYGTTRFTYGISGDSVGPADRRFLNIVDPLGYSEREETFEPATNVPPTVPASLVPQGMANLVNEYLQWRDGYHWNKHQYAAAGCTENGNCNYNDALLTHFTHDAADPGFRWYTVESDKEPLENRVWYTYPGQSSGNVSGTYDRPDAIGRVLDDGQTQLTKFSYNTAGNPKEFADPVGRTTTLAYAANRIDIDSVAQLTGSGPQTIARFTYNGQHRPLTYTDAAGRTTRYTYNSAGQLTSLTDALGQTTRREYDPTGDLVKIVNADGKVAASFTYDAFHRIASYTDAGGWTVKYSYDAANRLVKATYPDGTADKYTYHLYDLSLHTDRQGHQWSFAHDADRRLISMTDPLGHVTRYGYWEDGSPKTLTDANGRTTSWDIDIESRPTAKIYADGTATTYAYEYSTSRLASATDALGQTKNYSYALDNRLAGILYQNASNRTPSVGFLYDPYFPRLVAMTDGAGKTTYGYVAIGKSGALRLEQDSGPLPNDAISYAYDALGRVVGCMVGGAASETFAYDKIGRLVDHGDALGKFAYSYLGETRQITHRQLVGGNVSTSWSYLPNTGDRRLKSIVNTSGREFDFVTTPENLITQIAEKKSGKPAGSWTFGYDNDYRLLSAVASKGAKYGYALDSSDNITSFKSPSGERGAVYNKVNELTSLAGKPFVYDADGELTSDGIRRYAWDAENRLVGVTQAGTRTSFAYDGLARRVEIATTSDGRTATADYLWCGLRICQSRNGDATIARLYFPEGEAIPASKASLYYGPDQLGSVRDVYAKSPVFSIVQQYDYDPYGNPTVAPSTGPVTDFRYAGMLLPNNGSADAGLYLTQFRAYDPTTARWLSRDPIGEKPVAPNLFAYVGDDPLNLVDPSGLGPSLVDLLDPNNPLSPLFPLNPFNPSNPFNPFNPDNPVSPLYPLNPKNPNSPFNPFYPFSTPWNPHPYILAPPPPPPPPDPPPPDDQLPPVAQPVVPPNEGWGETPDPFLDYYEPAPTLPTNPPDTTDPFQDLAPHDYPNIAPPAYVY